MPTGQPFLRLKSARSILEKTNVRNIIVDQKEDVLTIPKVYLINGNQVETEDGPVSVKIGLQNLDQVEILEGIDANTIILKPGE